MIYHALPSDSGHPGKIKSETSRPRGKQLHGRLAYRAEGAKLNFEQFDPKVGVNGYFNAIRTELFPNSTPGSVDAAALNLRCRIYTKGSIFSRVRLIHESEFSKFNYERLTPKEFFPPTHSVAKIRIGRFNNKGERKLYLADHPYIALRECGIEPGDYFLFGYFSLKVAMRFIEVNPKDSKFCKLTNDLLQSKDERFYEVINRVYEKYLNYEGIQGIAYKSVKVNEGYQDDVWGEVKSTTNLAMAEENIPSADLVVGWFAQCDGSYRPRFFRMFRSLSPKKKNKFTSFSYHNNKSKFIFENSRAMDEIRHLRRKSEIFIQREEFVDLKSSPIKINLKD